MIAHDRLPTLWFGARKRLSTDRAFRASPVPDADDRPGLRYNPHRFTEGEITVSLILRCAHGCGHSPDPDDAFMFYGIAAGKVDTAGFEIEQVLEDIETLNRRALEGELEVTAVSIHAYAHLADRYALMPCGASMGDGYGPCVVARSDCDPQELRQGRSPFPAR